MSETEVSSRVKLRFTWVALYYGGLLGVLLLFAINYRNNVIYLVFCLLSAVSLLSFFETYRSLKGLRVQSGSVDSVYAGNPLNIPFLLCSSGKEHPGIEVLIEIEDEQYKAGIAVVEAGGVAHVTVLCSELPRGVYTIEQCTVQTSQPYGFVHISQTVPVDIRAYVYPIPAGDKDLPGVESDTSQSTGGEDFVGFRRYQMGDSQKRIDWRSLARGGPLMVKHFGEPDGHGRHYLSSAHVADLPYEEGLQQLCQWVCDAELSGELYALECDGGSAQQSSGPEHKQACLELLAACGTRQL